MTAITASDVSGTMKSCWLTTQEPTDLVVLSIESARPKPQYAQIGVTERCFPSKPTDEHPLRHVVTVGLLDRKALEMLRDKLSRWLEDEGGV